MINSPIESIKFKYETETSIDRKYKEKGMFLRKKSISE